MGERLKKPDTFRGSEAAFMKSNATGYQQEREADQNRRQAERPNTFRGTDRAHREPQGDAER